MLKYNLTAVIASFALLFGMQAAAATYNITQTNSVPLANGPTYATVNLMAGTVGSNNAILFNVAVNASSFNFSGDGFGMQDFFLNSSASSSVSESDIHITSPDGWEVSQSDKGHNAGGGFKKFEFLLAGQGSGERTLSLDFWIDVDSSGATVADFLVENENGYLFATHIAGYSEPGETSAKFAGRLSDVVAVPDVPLPAAAWLFGSAILGLTVVARRRKAVV